MILNKEGQIVVKKGFTCVHPGRNCKFIPIGYVTPLTCCHGHSYQKAFCFSERLMEQCVTASLANMHPYMNADVNIYMFELIHWKSDLWSGNY